MPPDDADRRVPGDDRRLSDNDGGVLRRLARRSRTAAAVLVIVGVGVLVGALLLPNGVVTVFAALLALAGIGIGAVLTVQAMLWAAMSTAPLPSGGGAAALIGPSTPLSPGRPGAPLRRRLGAAVVPVRVTDGPQPGGGALLIHARADGVALGVGDGVRLWQAARRGPEPLPAAGNPEQVRGRFVLRRDSDGAVFVGTTRLTDVL